MSQTINEIVLAFYLVHDMKLYPALIIVRSTHFLSLPCKEPIYSDKVKEEEE